MHFEMTSRVELPHAPFTNQPDTMEPSCRLMDLVHKSTLSFPDRHDRSPQFRGQSMPTASPQRRHLNVRVLKTRLIKKIPPSAVDFETADAVFDGKPPNATTTRALK